MFIISRTLIENKNYGYIHQKDIINGFNAVNIINRISPEDKKR